MRLFGKFRDKRKGILSFEDYLLLYLHSNTPENKRIKIDHVHFWGNTLLIVETGMKIRMDNGHILTPSDCFIELDDAAKELPEFRILLWLRQKKKYFGW